jgi:D-serine deaminase-like pyridoxal phosphate-dependent protein
VPESLDTPVVRIDLDAVDRNIARMQANAHARGLDFRAHVKTHKLPLLAHRQLQAGAVGVACQKLGEAEVMAAAGVGPILITFPLVGDAKWRRAARLAREVHLSVTADSLVAVEGLSSALDAGAEVGVYVDCDVARWRTGVPSAVAAVDVALAVERLPGLRFAGLFTHPTPLNAGDVFGEIRDAFDGTGLSIPAISVGGTLTAYGHAPADAMATELRAGTYVYGDRSCLAAGVTPEADCAMRVVATVVSTPADDRAILDAGSKTLTSDAAEGVDDGLFGLVVDEPSARLTMLSEEHGHLDLSACPGAFAVGQTVEIIPNHACGVTNLHDHVDLHRSGGPTTVAAVAARGQVR